MINGTDVYATGSYSVNGIDNGLLVTKWTSNGQHVWTSKLNQLTTADGNDGIELGYELWCNGSGTVYISGAGTALSRVDSSGTITSLNVSSYDQLTDIDVNGSYIIAGGGKEGCERDPTDESYLKKFTIGGQLVWQNVYGGFTSFAGVRDVEVVGDTIVGIKQEPIGLANIVIWNATGDEMSSRSLGMIQAAEMEFVGSDLYVAGSHITPRYEGFLMKILSNGTIAWTRTVRDEVIVEITDLCVSGGYVYTCGFITHQDAKGDEGFVIKWNDAGVQMWNYTWDAPGDDNAKGIAADATGIYVTGLRPDTYDDLFVMKLRLDGKVPVPTIGKNVTGTPLSGTSIQFTVGGTTGDGSPTWFWDFGDGTNSTLASPIHAFAAGGSYSVSLNVTDVDGSSAVVSEVVDIVQDLVPAASFAASSTPVFTGTVVTFTYTGTCGNAPAKYLWTFGAGGLTSTQQNATFTFAAEGTYNVSLAVTDDDGDVGRAWIDVHVNAPDSPGLDPGTIVAVTVGSVAAIGIGFTLTRRRRVRKPPVP